MFKFEMSGTKLSKFQHLNSKLGHGLIGTPDTNTGPGAVYYSTLMPCSFQQHGSPRWSVDVGGMFKRPKCEVLPPMDRHLEGESEQTIFVHQADHAAPRCGNETGWEVQHCETLTGRLEHEVRPVLLHWLHS